MRRVGSPASLHVTLGWADGLTIKPQHSQVSNFIKDTTDLNVTEEEKKREEGKEKEEGK